MPCVSPEGDVHGLARGQKGFTLVELIVVIAVLGILSLILVPQFSLYGDKAMGTTAASDARTAISVCTAHNMDNIDPLDQDYLNTYMSLVPDGGANNNGVTTGATGGHDASNSKYMKYDSTSSKINYWYRRGDVVLFGQIDLINGNTVWSTSLDTGKRADSLAQGLKIVAGTSGSAGAVGELGLKDTTHTWAKGASPAGA